MNFTWMDLARYVEVTALILGGSLLLARILPMPDARQRLRFLYLTLILCLVAPLCAVRHERQVLSLDSPPTRFESIDVVHTPDGTLYIERPLASLWMSVGPVARWMLLLAALRMLWLCVGLIRLSLYRRRAKLLTPLPDHLREVRTRQRVDAQLYVSNEVNGPVTFGFLKPTVLLPEYFDEIGQAQQSAAVCHELAHVRRNDAVTVFGEEVLRSLLWFHPLIWWLLDRIQLCREEVVDSETIAITGDRATYLETLLAFAQRTAIPDLAPATPFLKRNHLIERMNAIAKEVNMPDRVRRLHAFALYTLMPCALALGIWLLPLHGQPELARDTPGITIDPAFRLLHRGPIELPAELIAKNIAGEVVVNVTVSDSGDVTEASVVSGPEELRAIVLHAVLGWHFDTRSAVPPRRFDITVRFEPALAASLPAPQPIALSQLFTVNILDASTLPEPLRQHAVDALGLEVGDNITQMEVLEKLKRLRAAEPGINFAWSAPNDALEIHLFPLGARPLMSMLTVPAQIRIASVDVDALSEPLRQRVLDKLNLREGDVVTREELAAKEDSMLDIDRHLVLVRLPARGHPDQMTLRVVATSRDVPPASQSLRLIGTVAPEYPPTARQARVQGSVRFSITVGTDGAVRAIELISGPALLVQSATEAVKQYRFEPPPVETKTRVAVNFKLL